MSQRRVDSLTAGIVIAMGLLWISGPLAGATRGPSQQETIEVSEALREMGFQRWKDLRFEGGVWKVKGARHRNGKEYDLNVDPVTQMIVKREHND